MKATGIVRKVDELGRIVLPIELRRTLDINVGDPLEIYVDESSVVLKPYRRGCILCGSVGDTAEFSGKTICIKCAKEIAAALKQQRKCRPGCANIRSGQRN